MLGHYNQTSLRTLVYWVWPNNLNSNCLYCAKKERNNCAYCDTLANKNTKNYF